MFPHKQGAVRAEVLGWWLCVLWLFFSVIKRGPLGSLASVRASAVHVAPIFTVLDFSPHHHLFSTQMCPKAQGTRGRVTFQYKAQVSHVFLLDQMCPLPTRGKILQLKTDQVAPFKWREADRVSVEKVQSDKGWSHILSYPSLGRQIFKRIRPDTSWRGKDNALGKPPNSICSGISIKETRMSSQGPWKTISCISTPRSWHTHQPRAHLPVCEFSLQTIKEQTPLQLEKIYSSLQESCRCS